MIPGSANPLLLQSAAEAGGYTISRSVRFNSADSAYLSRTPGSAGNRKTWTWAGWVKRSVAGADEVFFFAGNDSSNNRTDRARFYFEANEVSLDFGGGTGSCNISFSGPVYRDPSAWFHLVISVDTNESTVSNAFKVYINGVQTVSATSTGNVAYSSFDTPINNNVVHEIGRRGNGSEYFNGYLADVFLIDGQALDPTSFGEFDDNGIWQPIAYSGSYGTNGFHLPFSDNSTAAALGTDSAGSNDWTVNNISVASGAGNDSVVDVPSSTGTDTGVGGEVRGNYCTWNPLDLPSSSSLTNGNLDFVNTSGSWKSTVGTIAISSGKWYAEFNGNPSSAMVGVVQSNWNANIADSRFWASSTGYAYHSDNGYKYNNDSGAAYGATYTGSDVIGVALDMDAGTLTFYKNGTSQGQAFSGLTGAFKFAYGGTNMTANFGQRPFAYPVSGFKALNTSSLPAPVITKPSEYMDVKLYTGNGSTQTISGLEFSPDLVWIKARSAATRHDVFDTVRGVQKYLETNSTAAEVTDTNALDAFLSDGFSLGNDSPTNGNGVTFSAWTWDAGSSTVTNTAGSITSSVRANATAGFSIVTWTGPGSGSYTVGHGLGVKPGFVVVKARNTTRDWYASHSGLIESTSPNGWSEYLNFNKTDAKTPGTYDIFRPHTSTLLTLGSNSDMSSANTYVAYCFAPVAGYSAMGSYTGNGSQTDGTFIYTGFKPRFFLAKASSTTSDWIIWDSERDPYNASISRLFPNLSNAESVDAANDIDFVSNGIKMRTGTANASGATYIYYAVAENPFQYARAR